MEKIKVIYKIETNTGTNVNIDADGYSGIRIINTGNVTLYYNGVIPINAGQEFELSEEPYVTVQSNVYLSWAGYKDTDTPRAIILRKYYN